MRKIADGESYRVPPTIDGPAILPEIEDAAQTIGYGRRWHQGKTFGERWPVLARNPLRQALAVLRASFRQDPARREKGGRVKWH